MKKLNGMKRDFSSLENKKMNDLSKITGGLMMAETTMQWTHETGSGSDTGVYRDNKLVAVITEPA
ncbi:grasp-with-spasm system A modified peptide [Chryseobacterium gleum]|uniref:grasp-with-spasm system A modified peptide n=1 Tax=Chryseobacterium gleum TaxID=250 RepID=UPI001E3407DB|nr:grasp-with-spasm system A modified peptide [Chryseobacterium gleum]MCD9618053.1 grasp-with-spasm system A modified peptide [Chryseobacterium gleum]